MRCWNNAPDCLTIQAHPEFERDYMELLMERRAGAATAEELAAVAATLDRPTDRDRTAKLLSDVLRQGDA